MTAIGAIETARVAAVVVIITAVIVAGVSVAIIAMVVLTIGKEAGTVVTEG